MQLFFALTSLPDKTTGIALRLIVKQSSEKRLINCVRERHKTFSVFSPAEKKLWFVYNVFIRKQIEC